MLVLTSAGFMALDVIERDGQMWTSAGGTAANVAAAYAHLGGLSRAVGTIGDDPAGRLVVEDLRRLGVDVRDIERDGRARTPVVLHHIYRQSHRFSLRCPECGGRLGRFSPRRLAVTGSNPATDIFFFDRAVPYALAIAEATAERGGLVMFEPSVVGSEAQFSRAVHVSHVVKYSRHRSRNFAYLLSSAPRTQLRIVTDGRHGLEYWIGDGPRQRLAAYPADLVDAAGAGDWTTAGFLNLNGARRPASERATEIEAALGYGQAVAALNAEMPGARALCAVALRDVNAAVAALQARTRTSPLRSSLVNQVVPRIPAFCHHCA